MFQTFCIAAIVATALLESIGLYQWSQQTELRVQQTGVILLAEVKPRHRS